MAGAIASAMRRLTTREESMTVTLSTADPGGRATLIAFWIARLEPASVFVARSSASVELVTSACTVRTWVSESLDEPVTWVIRVTVEAYCGARVRLSASARTAPRTVTASTTTADARSCAQATESRCSVTSTIDGVVTSSRSSGQYAVHRHRHDAPLGDRRAANR